MQTRTPSQVTMAGSMILKLSKHVQQWARAGIITPEQGEQILELEESPSRPWVIYGVAGIAVITILTGILSLVAANWENIGPELKLLAYLLLQTLSGVLLYRLWNREDWIREAALTFFSIFFLVGIGLTGQVFHLHSEGWEGLLLWLALSLPVVLASKSWLPNHFWLGGFAITASIWVATNHSLIPNNSARVMTFASLPFLVTSLGFWGHQFPALSNHFKLAATVWGLVVILAVATPYGNAMWTVWSPFLSIEQTGYLWIPWSALLITAAGSLLRPELPRLARWSTTLMLIVLGAYLTIPILWATTEGESSVLLRVVGCAGFITIWGLAATSCAILNYRRLFDAATLIIAFRLVSVYFEIFGNLSQTGFGLIISGSVLLAITYGWYKSRRRVADWLTAEGRS